MIDLSGRVALVTGGSRGLGRSMALGFAQAGASVVVTSRKLDACKAVADEISAEGGVAFAHACHVGHWDQVNDLIEVVYDQFGRVDVLVNNAGMSPVYDCPSEISEALYEKVLDVNLKGPFRLCAEVGKRMKVAGGGSIINISSGSAERPQAGTIPYAASKAALNAITKGFAHAYGPEVRVNCIAPGAFLTDVTAGWDMEAFSEAARERIAMQRAGDPDEIVGAALYFASDHSSFTSGATLSIDGCSS